MDIALINRYQPGGDIFQSLAATYGDSNARNIAAAALSGDESQVNAAIVAAKYGAPLDDSTIDALGTQLTTDPLAAPLAGLNNILGNSFFSLLKSPYVIGALAVAGFIAFGGLDLIKRKYFK